MVVAEEPFPLGRRVERFARTRWYVRPFVVIAAVTALAGGMRFYHLSAPHAFVFDEVYYAKDGCFDAGFPYQQCKLDSPNEQTFTVHPPLGRWIIAGGEAAFGNRPFGWRFASAVAGTLSVLLLSILAYRLFRSAMWAGVAGLLLATEDLNFVQSRVSMLDIMLTTFVVAGFLFLVLDREWMARRSGDEEPTAEASDEVASPIEAEEAALLCLPPDRPPSPILRPWRLAAGFAFGAAVATKWSGASALLGALILAVTWERTRRRRVGLPHPLREALRDESFGIFVFLVLVPVGVYAASYARWFAENGLNLSGWWAVQRGMADYSIALRATHPYASRPWTWLLLARPVAYYYKGSPPGTAAEILGIGNQAVFWGSLLTFPYALFAWVTRKDWRAGFILVAFFAQYVPWFFAARTSFLFYIAPMTPFMVLAGVYGLRSMWEVRVGDREVRPLAPLVVLLVVVAVGLFAFFFPVLTGRTISYASWHQRMWFPGWI
jgi:dolichyl-phosphate-mannose--protein O-mannosyl transferase